MYDWKKMKNFIILISVYNDWKSVSKLLKEIDLQIIDQDSELSVLIINDASTEDRPVIESSFKNIKSIRVMNMKKAGHLKILLIEPYYDEGVSLVVPSIPLGLGLIGSYLKQQIPNVEVKIPGSVGEEYYYSTKNQNEQQQSSPTTTRTASIHSPSGSSISSTKIAPCIISSTPSSVPRDSSSEINLSFICLKY